MLVLTRRQDDTVVIDGRIEIKVLQVKGKSIRLGINAPADVKILRGELQPFDIEKTADVASNSQIGSSRIAESQTTYQIERSIEITGDEVDLGMLQQSLTAQAS